MGGPPATMVCVPMAYEAWGAAVGWGGATGMICVEDPPMMRVPALVTSE